MCNVAAADFFAVSNVTITSLVCDSLRSLQLARSYVRSIKRLTERGAGTKYSPAFLNALDVFEDRVNINLAKGEKTERKTSLFGR